MTKKIAALLACIAVFSAVQAQQLEKEGSAGQKPTRAQRFDRGLAFDTKTPVIPKGLWVAGLSGSYSQHDNDDYNFLIVKNLSSKGHTLNVGPMLHYVFANNQSIGVRFQYRRMWQSLDSVYLDLGDLTDSDSTIGPYEYSNQTYMGFISYRYYVPMGTSKRFVFFNEIQVGIGGGQQKELSGVDDNGNKWKTGVYQKSVNLKVGFVPGLAVFITNSVAAEVSIGLLGYEWNKMTQTGTNLTEGAGRTTSKIATKFDFFSIAFGMTFYL